MQWVVLWVSVQGKCEGPNQSRRRCYEVKWRALANSRFDLLQSANRPVADNVVKVRLVNTPSAPFYFDRTQQLLLGPEH